MNFGIGVVFGFCATILLELALILIYANSKGGKK